MCVRARRRLCGLADLAVRVRVRGRGGGLAAEGMEQRCEAGVAQRMTGFAEPGREGVACQRLAGPVQVIANCAGS